jgi:hypothetical protein
MFPDLRHSVQTQAQSARLDWQLAEGVRSPAATDALSVSNAPLRIFSTSRVLRDLINMLQYCVRMAQCDCHSLRRIDLIRVQDGDWASKTSDRILESCPSFITTNKLIAILALSWFASVLPGKHRNNASTSPAPLPSIYCSLFVPPADTT